MHHPLFSLLNDTSNFCCYCGLRFKKKAIGVHGQFKTVDHLVPLSKGGSNQPYNKKSSCQDCNFDKNDKLPEAYMNLVASRLDNVCEGLQTAPYDVVLLVLKYNLEIKLINCTYLFEYFQTMGDRLLKKNDTVKQNPPRKNRKKTTDALNEITLQTQLIENEEQYI